MGIVGWIGADHVDPDRVYVRSYDLVTSGDAGASWTDVTIAASALVPDPAVAGRVWRERSMKDFLRSDDGGTSWDVVPGSPPDMVDFVVDRNGRVIVFTQSQEIWTLSPDGAWDLAGTTPVEIGGVRVLTGENPDDLTLYDFDLAYVTHTLGR
jgi:hypothetical protein